MPKRKKHESEPPPPSSDPVEPEAGTATDLIEESDNGHAGAEAAEPVETSEPPAKVKYSAEGSPRAVAAAARKIANVAPPPVATPASDLEPPDDTDALLADGHNMVVVRRTFPKSVEMRDGSKRRCATKLPDRYECPTTREKIENDVFDRFGGSEYKCTIHPSTTNGETTTLGFFVIEHPNLDEPPYFPDDPPVQEDPPYDPRTSAHTSGGDPTMRETDGLARLRADAERRVERARILKETRELEREAKRLEDEIDDKKPAVAPAGESEEIRKLREQIAEKDRLLSEKKVNDRFDSLENSIKTLTTAIATRPAEKSGEEPVMKFIIEKMKSDDTRFSEMMKAVTAKQTAPTTTPSADGDLDKLIDRFTKLQAITGGGRKSGEGRLSEIEQKLIDIAYDKLMGGEGESDGGGEDTEDVAKLAVKQFAPILKTFVEKKMDQENAANGGAPITEEQKQRIYAEAAQAAARKVTADLAAQGIHLAQAPDGKLVALPAPEAGKKPVVPPRQGSQPGKIVDVRRTGEGVVKTVKVEPHSSARPVQTPKEPAPEAQVSTTPTNTNTGGDEVKYAEFPGLGQGGGVLKVELPAPPDDVQYDRRRNVNFILDAIRSEIIQEIPQKRPDASFVLGDVMELLDDEILERISRVEDGTQMEGILAEFGDRAKIDEVKKSGEAEDVKVWLRRLVTTIGDTYRDKKKAL